MVTKNTKIETVTIDQLPPYQGNLNSDEGDFLPIVDLNGDDNKSGPATRRLTVGELKKQMMQMNGDYISEFVRTFVESVSGYRPGPETAPAPKDVSENLAEMINRAYTYIKNNVVDLDVVIDSFTSKFTKSTREGGDQQEIPQWVYTAVNDKMVEAIAKALGKSVTELKSDKLYSCISQLGIGYLTKIDWGRYDEETNTISGYWYAEKDDKGQTVRQVNLYHPTLSDGLAEVYYYDGDTQTPDWRLIDGFPERPATILEVSGEGLPTPNDGAKTRGAHYGAQTFVTGVEQTQAAPELLAPFRTDKSEKGLVSTEYKFAGYTFYGPKDDGEPGDIQANVAIYVPDDMQTEMDGIIAGWKYRSPLWLGNGRSEPEEPTRDSGEAVEAVRHPVFVRAGDAKKTLLAGGFFALGNNDYPVAPHGFINDKLVEFTSNDTSTWDYAQYPRLALVDGNWYAFPRDSIYDGGEDDEAFVLLTYKDAENSWHFYYQLSSDGSYREFTTAYDYRDMDAENKREVTIGWGGGRLAVKPEPKEYCSSLITYEYYGFNPVDMWFVESRSEEKTTYKYGVDWTLDDEGLWHARCVFPHQVFYIRNDLKNILDSGMDEAEWIINYIFNESHGVISGRTEEPYFDTATLVNAGEEREIDRMFWKDFIEQNFTEEVFIRLTGGIISRILSGGGGGSDIPSQYEFDGMKSSVNLFAPRTMVRSGSVSVEDTIVTSDTVLTFDGDSEHNYTIWSMDWEVWLCSGNGYLGYYAPAMGEYTYGQILPMINVNGSAINATISVDAVGGATVTIAADSVWKEQSTTVFALFKRSFRRVSGTNGSMLYFPTYWDNK